MQLFAELSFCLLVPPDPPVLELKEAKGNTITIAWTPAAFEGDSPITGFHLESKTTNGDMQANLLSTNTLCHCHCNYTHVFLPSKSPKASWDNTKMVVDFSASQTEATLVELNPATYSIRMFAESVMGTSTASNVLTVTTGDAGVLCLNFLSDLNRSTAFHAHTFISLHSQIFCQRICGQQFLPLLKPL